MLKGFPALSRGANCRLWQRLGKFCQLLGYCALWTPFCLVQVEVTSGMGFTCCLLGALCYARAKHGQLLDRGFEEQGQRLRFFHSWPQLFVESVF